MKYSCDHCSYETDKKANFVRHLNRKFKCNKGVQKVSIHEENLNVGQENINAGQENINAVQENINAGQENINAGQENINAEVCTMCNKRFSSKQWLQYHKKKCKGISCLQCEICLKIFKSYQGKYQHKKNVLCYPPPPPPTADVIESSINTINTINNINNNTHNGDQLNNSNNIYQINQYNAFGDEGIEQLEKFLGDDSRILERFKQASKKRLYGVRDIQNDIFFNPDNPKGFSIIKPDKYGSSVRVRNSNGEFEYMEFDDVRDPMLNYIEKYIEIYNKTRNKFNVKFRDPKEQRILYTFLKIMNDDLDIYLNEDLKEDLDIEDESNESDDDEENTKYKHFDKVSLDNIHVQTKKFFKCKKGEFVLKEHE